MSLDNMIEINKRLIIIKTQIDINKYKNKFIDYLTILRDIHANTIYVQTEKDVKNNIKKVIDDAFCIVDVFEAYCMNLHETEIIDNVNKGTFIHISNVPIIHFEINNVSKLITDIILMVNEIKKDLRLQTRKNNEKLMQYV